MTEGLSREVEIDPRHAALLLIDVQNYTANRDGGVYRGLVPREIDKRYGYFFATLRESAIPNMQRLQKACRQGGIEILYTVIESLTRDGRDRGLDYKISGLHVPKGSPDAAVLAELAPAEDEIVIPKTSSSPFISTNIDYVLRNLGVHFLMIAGVLTDQCVDFGSPRRLRPRLSRDAGGRRLRDAQPRAPRRLARQQPRLLPPARDGGAGFRDRPPYRRAALIRGATAVRLSAASGSRSGAPAPGRCRFALEPETGADLGKKWH